MTKTSILYYIYTSAASVCTDILLHEWEGSILYSFRFELLAGGHSRILTWLTLNTSIVSMATAVVRVSHSVMSTVYKSCLVTSADHIVQKDGTSTLAKESIRVHHST